MVTVESALQVLDNCLFTGMRCDCETACATVVPQTGTHFVVVVKPEVLKPPIAAAALADVVDVLMNNDVGVRRCAVIPAAEFVHNGRLFGHYPRLHRIATAGPSEMCTDGKRQLGYYTVGAIGAFGALARDPRLSASALEVMCRTSGIKKLGAATYASNIDVYEEPTIVLNGFVPALIETYLSKGAVVGLLECHSARPIGDLRTNLLGSLDPSSAAPSCLRGSVNQIALASGIHLSEGRNGVHLSAGHLEGMFQVWRYFAAANGSGLPTTALGNTLDDHGVSADRLVRLADDHNIDNGNGDQISPFGATEDVDRQDVVDMVVRWTMQGTESIA